MRYAHNRCQQQTEEVNALVGNNQVQNDLSRSIIHANYPYLCTCQKLPTSKSLAGHLPAAALRRPLAGVIPRVGRKGRRGLSGSGLGLRGL